ncbi:MAG TPA: hypothetical protein VIM73_16705 [Polyangiaceae bacterium]
MAHASPVDAVRPLLEATFRYLKEHPDELVRVLRNALAFRFGLPIPALRWLAGRANGGKAPRDVEIGAIPPGVRVGASFDLMSTPLRAAADIFVERVEIASDRMLFEIRLANVKLTVLDETVESPLAALLRSGALDLSRPGNLMAFMPKRPPMLVEAKDDRIVIDLLRHQKIRNDGSFRRWVSRIVPLVTVQAIGTDHGHLDVELRAFPDGVRRSIDAVRRTFREPG